eukprot:TRINITY_DN1159_c1_g1_i2.p1 TRINITY_DN1159_c1_g1~~TRINITY_DN1159_c1_g1_i2.p1  ORF type:complete len:645 (-),score=189.55 TRINITY_DN1159_c1_g1_i2:105-2039(-)
MSESLKDSKKRNKKRKKSSDIISNVSNNGNKSMMSSSSLNLLYSIHQTNNLTDFSWDWTHLLCGGEVWPNARHVHSANIYEDSMYVFGGYTDGGIHTNDFFCLHFPTRTWKKLPYVNHTPEKRHSHTSVIMNDKLFIFGGIGSASRNSSQPLMMNSLYYYDFIEKKWCVLFKNDESNEDIPCPRWGHSAVVYEGKMYIFGGYSNQHYLNDLWVYDPESNQWELVVPTGKKPNPRHFHAAVTYKDSMYIISGFGLSANHEDIFRYNFVSNEWTCFDNKTPPRRGHSAIIHENCVYIFGGKNEKQRFSSLLEYNFDTKTWADIQTTNSPSNRYFHSCVKWKDNTMIIFAGLGKTNYNDIFMLYFGIVDEDIHSTNNSFGSDLLNLFNNPIFSDITFIVEDQEIHAHKCILYARSEYFKALLSNNDMKENKNNKILINEITYDTLIVILQWIYTGTINSIKDEILIDVLQASDKFLLSNLKKKASNYIRLGITKNNVLDILRLSFLYHANELQYFCYDFINKYCPEIKLQLLNSTNNNNNNNNSNNNNNAPSGGFLGDIGKAKLKKVEINADKKNSDGDVGDLLSQIRKGASLKHVSEEEKNRNPAEEDESNMLNVIARALIQRRERIKDLGSDEESDDDLSWDDDW